MAANVEASLAARTGPAFTLRSPRRALDGWLLVGIVAFFGLLILALFGERVAPHEPIYFVVEHGSDPRPYDPGLVFPFGSDVLGRDLLSLVLAGARTTLAIVVLGGLARVLAGVLIAAIASAWRPARMLTETLAELLSAVPATLVALVLVLVFVKADRNVVVFIGALLITGWAGPYRVVRAELDRLARAPYTEGARAIGVGGWRLVRRHHLPHLVPLIAINLSQQVVASLVLVAELGVLSVFVGATRVINIEESLSLVRTGPQNRALIADPPEWGGLLANARSIESLWSTRWLILVPGVAFAITAVGVAAIGFAVARRYARRDVTQELRGRGAAALAAAVLGLFVVSGLVPERYAAARDWATAARGEVRPDSDLASAFAGAGLRPLAATYAVQRQTAAVVQTGPATANVGAASVAESWPRTALSNDVTQPHARSFVAAATGGGVVEAPLVYVGRGITPSELPPRGPNPFDPTPDLGRLIKDYADDYASVDVRGKVVLLVRFLGVAGTSPRGRFSAGPSAEDSIARAIRRGAAAVLFVDPALPLYTDTGSPIFPAGILAGVMNPYLRAEKDSPPQGTSGVPVIVLDLVAAHSLVAPLGLDLSPFKTFDEPTPGAYLRSPARELGVTARVAVPLAQESATVTSVVGEVGGVPDEMGRVLVWAVRRAAAPNPTSDVLAALARELGVRRAPFIFVELDPSVAPSVNTQSVRDVLKDRRITLVLVLDQLQGEALKFTTPHGELIPALDLYADRAGARHEVTRGTSSIDDLAGLAPLVKTKTVLITGTGGDGDLRPDATALIAYLAGRLALGAEELPR